MKVMNAVFYSSFLERACRIFSVQRPFRNPFLTKIDVKLRSEPTYGENYVLVGFVLYVLPYGVHGERRTREMREERRERNMNKKEKHL